MTPTPGSTAAVPNAANILKWIEALDSGSYQPINPRCLEWENGGCYCAGGVGMAALGFTRDQYISEILADAMFGTDEFPREIDPCKLYNVDRLTFPEIAAKLREWCAANGVRLESPQREGGEVGNHAD